MAWQIDIGNDRHNVVTDFIYLRFQTILIVIRIAHFNMTTFIFLSIKPLFVSLNQGHPTDLLLNELTILVSTFNTLVKTYQQHVAVYERARTLIWSQKWIKGSNSF